MTRRKIPSEEDFARASAAMRKRARGLGQVRERILSRFGESGEIYEFYILDGSESSFRAYVFYSLDAHIAEAEESGLASRIKAAVFEELERVGRGTRDEIQVYFDFDSDENVEANYEGNYFLRLR